MTREHSPRPGAHWDTRVVPVEQVVPDELYGCRYCDLPATGHGKRYHHRTGLHTWQGPTLVQMWTRAGVSLPDAPWDGLERTQSTIDRAAQPEPRRNRRQRRDANRANRQKGQP